MTTKEIFASNLRIKKEQLNLSRAQLSIKLGAKRGRVGSYLEGKTLPRLEDLPKIVEVFKIDDIYTFLTEKIA